MEVKNEKLRLGASEIKAINSVLKNFEKPFRKAKVGDWIDSGGQATVHHLNIKNGNEKYVIKVLLNRKGYEKAVRFNEEFADICDQHQKAGEADIRNSVLKIKRSFIVNVADDILYCMIEKYHLCLKDYKGPKSNKARDDQEIAIRLGADLLPVLSAIEGKSFHRDIKPGNIFLKGYTLSKGLCLGDFGIVTNVNTKGTPTTKNIRGTHETASPDIVLRKDYPQFRNSNKGDMYSLAVTMYYYLNSREYPFIDVYDDDDELDYDIWEELRKKGCKPPKHGSQKLKEIVCKAIEFYPDKRFASCAEMLAELKKTEEYRCFISEPIGKSNTTGFHKKSVAQTEAEKKSQANKPQTEASSGGASFNNKINKIVGEMEKNNKKNLTDTELHKKNSRLINYIGKRLDGRYEIQEIVGVGSMAVVYKAYDNIDDRIVAVKILKEEYLADEEFRRRFKNESKAIAVLSHSNIIKVLNVSYGDRLQYIVTEYVEGVTLKEYVEHRGKLDIYETVYLTMQVLRALQHAHDKGVVHRDIKPQNIMVCSDGSIKITDFGVAKFSYSAFEKTRSIPYYAINSVYYMSPELLRGDETDDRADIYSVGVVLYEMLTGQLPFQSDNSVSVALMHLQGEPKRPREINSDIPIGLEQIVMHAMQKSKGDRYQSSSEMLLDIEEYKRNPAIRFNHNPFFEPAPSEVKRKLFRQEKKVVKSNDNLFKVNIEDDGFINADDLDRVTHLNKSNPRKKFEVRIEDDGFLNPDDLDAINRSLQKNTGEIYYSNRRPNNSPPVAPSSKTKKKYGNDEKTAFWIAAATIFIMIDIVLASIFFYYYVFPKIKLGEGAVNSDVNWTLYADGNLVISGEPESDLIYDSEHFPWHDVKDKVKKITVKDVDYIEEKAFYGMKSVTEIDISDTVKCIRASAFEETGFYNNPNNWENSILYIGNHLIKAKPNITGSCSIKDGTVTIADYAFSYCTKIENITIPNSISNIGEFAFRACRNLTSIRIPENVTTIDNGTFYYCYRLTDVIIPNSITYIGSFAFSGCYNLSDVYFRGSQTLWNKVVAENNISELSDATIHYNS